MTSIRFPRVNVRVRHNSVSSIEAEHAQYTSNTCMSNGVSYHGIGLIRYAPVYRTRSGLLKVRGTAGRVALGPEKQGTS